MVILFLILLLVLAATGALWVALKVAVGVALGVFLGFLLVGAFVWWRIRRALWGRSRRWGLRRSSGSRIEVLDRNSPYEPR